jgi:hypothetical protein
MTDSDLTGSVDVFDTSHPEDAETFIDWPDAMTHFDTLVFELVSDGWTVEDGGWASASNTRCNRMIRGDEITFVTSEVNQ